MKIRPCAKINLGLNIVSKRADGYHDLETVFYPVGIYDEIEINETDSDNGCSLEITGQEIEGDVEKNLVVKAYRLLSGIHPLPPVHITLNKQIPMQAGMGGGSADCAFTIRLLNEMFHLGMSVAEMEGYATRLGADCPFFITAKPSYAEGIGELLSPVDLDLSRYFIAIVKPPVAISTREAFAGIKVKRPQKCCRDIVQLPVGQWKDLLFNDFEESIIPQYPVIADIKKALYDEGALYAAMSGSGSAVFGIYEQNPESLKSLFPDCYVHVVKG
ncbi:MAG: 4-(cytidine 5'-diphospho)-2-C-methyl-D-erythritol kinase [Prevotella sp.]|nr:4-(cytidine 5'-diphospho)-2-C-methyl-D-erythritol kinase [Prevotella sp.]